MKAKEKLIEKLYTYIDHDANNSSNDELYGYLTENYDHDGNDVWLWYYDDNTDVALNERTEEIISDSETISKLFL